MTEVRWLYGLLIYVAIVASATAVLAALLFIHAGNSRSQPEPQPLPVNQLWEQAVATIEQLPKPQPP